MTDDERWAGLQQAEDMAYFKADLCRYSPERHTLDEKRDICNVPLDAVSPFRLLEQLAKGTEVVLCQACRACLLKHARGRVSCTLFTMQTTKRFIITLSWLVKRDALSGKVKGGPWLADAKHSKLLA